MDNCHGCKWLDETRPAGHGYCCMVARSKTQNEKVRRPDMPRCELYEAGDFKTRYDGLRPRSEGAGARKAGPLPAGSTPAALIYSTERR